MPPKKTCNTGARGEMPKRAQTNPWLSLPPKHCATCRQDTHTYDKHHRPAEKYLVWAKMYEDASGGQRPMGKECYLCYDTRRRYFTDSQAELLASFETEPSVEEDFDNFRRDKA